MLCAMQTVDWLVMGLYAAAVLAIGLWVGRGRQTTGDFFLGGRRMPVWAVFCSMVATELSAATFIGVPHAAYLGNWSYVQFAFGALAAKIVLAVWFITLYHRLNLITVYGFMEQRFGRRAHLCSAWFFLGGRLLASGVRLFIAGLAFATVTGFSVEVAIVVAGVIAAAYTLAGGIKAVIWTDTLQGAVFLVAAVAAIVVVVGRVDGGLGGALSAASEAGKLEVFQFPSLLTSGTSAEETWGFLGRLWEGFRTNYLQGGNSLVMCVLFAFFLGLSTHGTDQDMIQRLLTTRTGRGGGRALWLSGLSNFPLSILFLLVGTLLWAFYQGDISGFDGSYSIADDKRIFPIFVLNEMPTGLRGLVFAGLFAAAMSSLDSAVNALATTWSVDIRGHKDGSTTSLGGVKLATGVFSALLIGAAVVMVPYEKKAAAAGSADFSLVILALSAMTVVYGGLLGGFLVGLVTPTRGTDGSVFAGMLTGGILGLALFLQPVYLGSTPIGGLWWIIITALVSFGIGASRRGTGKGVVS